MQWVIWPFQAPNSITRYHHHHRHTSTLHLLQAGKGGDPSALILYKASASTLASHDTKTNPTRSQASRQASKQARKHAKEGASGRNKTRAYSTLLPFSPPFQSSHFPYIKPNSYLYNSHSPPLHPRPHRSQPGVHLSRRTAHDEGDDCVARNANVLERAEDMDLPVVGFIDTWGKEMRWVALVFVFYGGVGWWVG